MNTESSLIKKKKSMTNCKTNKVEISQIKKKLEYSAKSKNTTTTLYKNQNHKNHNPQKNHNHHKHHKSHYIQPRNSPIPPPKLTDFSPNLSPVTNAKTTKNKINQGRSRRFFSNVPKRLNRHTRHPRDARQNKHMSDILDVP